MRTNPNLATDETRTEHGSKNSGVRVYSVFNPWLRFTRFTPSLCAFVITLLALSVGAQQYAIEWFKIAGGGATAPSTGGVYAVSGTIGQVDTGRVASTNDSYRLEAGFWAIAIQQLGYPSLNIAQSGTNAVVSWVTTESGLILQRATDLATPTLWTDTGPAGLVNGTTNSVMVPLTPVPRQFFRLRRP